MGCSSPQEKIEDQMMKIKLLRIDIQMERENKIKELSKMTGNKIKYSNIPDYIDPEFAKQNCIIYDGEFMVKLSRKPKLKAKTIKASTKIIKPSTKTIIASTKTKRLSKSKSKTIKVNIN